MFPVLVGEGWRRCSSFPPNLTFRGGEFTWLLSPARMTGTIYENAPAREELFYHVIIVSRLHRWHFVDTCYIISAICIITIFYRMEAPADWDVHACNAGTISTRSYRSAPASLALLWHVLSNFGDLYYHDILLDVRARRLGRSRLQRRNYFNTLLSWRARIARTILTRARYFFVCPVRILMKSKKIGTTHDIQDGWL